MNEFFDRYWNGWRDVMANFKTRWLIQINDATGDGREQLDSVAQTLHSLGCRAMVAAVKRAVFLQAVTHDLDAAMGT